MIITSSFTKKTIVFLLAVIMTLSVLPVYAEEAPESESSLAFSALSDTQNPAKNSYAAYCEAFGEKVRPTDRIELTAENISGFENSTKEMTVFNDKSGAVMDDKTSWVEWEVTVSESGAYNVCVEYYPLEGTGRDIPVGLLIDGEVPFSEAKSFNLPRIWKDKVYENGATVRKDEFGNDLRPARVESPRWTKAALSDSLGMYDEPYLIYLESGVHKIRLVLHGEAMVVSRVVFENEPVPSSYAEYVNQYTDLPQVTGEVICLEAENTFEKSSATLYPLYDRNNPATLPNDPAKVRLNTIGGSNWSKPGQSITWKITVPKDGLYTLAFRARQDLNPGMNSYRTLYINGEIPFAEARNIEFPYDSKWKIKTLGDENPWQFYLKNGDELTLTVSAGPLCEALRNVQQSVLNLNSLYRKVIIITGITPDIYRDYGLEGEIPELFEIIAEEKERLLQASDIILGLTGKAGPQTASIMRVVEMLERFTKSQYAIVEELGSLKGNLEGLGSLLLTFSEQPLELDCIYAIPSNQAIPKSKAGFWQSVVFFVRQIFASYVNDYQSANSISDEADVLNVWVQVGRDQMQIINMMALESFIKDSGIPVRFSLADVGNLTDAIISGVGPDVVVSMPTEGIANLAMRGMLVDLSQPDFKIEEKMKGKYLDSVWTQYQYNGSIFGVPERMFFPMAFYRTDIFEELGLTPPDTWEEFYKMITILQNNNMNVGIPETVGSTPGVSSSIAFFQSLLFQKGSTYYNDSLTKTLFDTPAAYESFEEWSALYSEYGVERTLDFFNRFRTGEIPFGIANYTMYNQIAASAPELRGLWKMALCPGTMQEDGSIDRSVPSVETGSSGVSASGKVPAGYGTVIVSLAQKRGIAQEAYRFVEWWTSNEVQTQYAKEVEDTIGVISRYEPAGVKVMDQVGWTGEEWELLQAQMKWIKNVPIIPGDYLVSRSLSDALRSSFDGVDPRRALSVQNRNINAEIERKRKEFRLDMGDRK